MPACKWQRAQLYSLRAVDGAGSERTRSPGPPSIVSDTDLRWLEHSYILYGKTEPYPRGAL